MPAPPTTPDVPPAVAPAGRWRSIAWAIRAAQVRLRFLAALAVAFLVVGRWDAIRTYWDRWTAPAAHDAAMGAVSTDTEYFCPMDPGVLSDWPGKCPICHMALVRRKKGDMGPLPNGVVARVQLSPERIQLAGIRTAIARFEPLAREFRVIGEATAEGGKGRVVAEIAGEDASWIAPGAEADVRPDPSDGSEPIKGRVVAVEDASRVVIEAPSPLPGRFAAATIRVPIAGREPFLSMPRGTPPIRPGEPRVLYLCPEHPSEPKLKAGRCPKDDLPLDRLALAVDQRLGYWCPMHPQVMAEAHGAECGECGGMPLVPRLITYGPPGRVLAIPEAAVIDTGTQSMVYVETMPGTFDGVEVKLGPRCGKSYPVIAGLEPGQAVAEAGAFLVDAETRLNPSLAAGYFGAKRADHAPLAAEAAPTKTLDFEGLSPAARDAALAQETCPVTGKKLGSMGPPPRIEIEGRPLFLCCEGCEGALRAKPDKYITKMKAAPGAAHHR